MRVHTIARQHPMAAILAAGALPMVAQPVPTMPQDDKQTGFLLAQECIAFMQTNAQGWQGKAMQLFRLTNEARTAFLSSLSAWLKLQTATVQTITGQDEKRARKNLASATVQISKLRTIANALNSGGSMKGLQEFHHVNDPQNLGFQSIYEWAQTFSKAKAGRTRDSMLVKLRKWIEANEKDDKNTREDKDVLEQLLELHNRLV
jgi:hypothetical protein